MTDICFALRPRPWQELGPGLYDHLQIIINWVSMTDQGTHKTVIEQLGPLPFPFLLAYFPENCGNRLGDDVPIDVIICIQSMDRLHR